ncbi:hypothetical protein VP01_761g2 [Puccinia sorghi]|uniref:Uncharacterized protein n=1 Tax=Puccinia sorghi TaxID=27349 RepID=A0A0L6UBX4_9BASI|nr:hypothetical protein VP01_761g2 [Puccinia sorghi]
MYLRAGQSLMLAEENYLHFQKKLDPLPAVDMQHAPAKLPSKLHLFACVDVLEQSLIGRRIIGHYATLFCPCNIFSDISSFLLIPEFHLLLSPSSISLHFIMILYLVYLSTIDTSNYLIDSLTLFSTEPFQKRNPKPFLYPSFSLLSMPLSRSFNNFILLEKFASCQLKLSVRSDSISSELHCSTDCPLHQCVQEDLVFDYQSFLLVLEKNLWGGIGFVGEMSRHCSQAPICCGLDQVWVGPDDAYSCLLSLTLANQLTLQGNILESSGSNLYLSLFSDFISTMIHIVSKLMLNDMISSTHLIFSSCSIFNRMDKFLISFSNKFVYKTNTNVLSPQGSNITKRTQCNLKYNYKINSDPSKKIPITSPPFENPNLRNSHSCTTSLTQKPGCICGFNSHTVQKYERLRSSIESYATLPVSWEKATLQIVHISVSLRKATLTVSVAGEKFNYRYRKI